MAEYQIVVCGGIVPDPLQTLEPVSTADGFGLKNEAMLPNVLDPWATSALFEAAHLAEKNPGSKVYLVTAAPKAKLQEVMMTIGQKVPFELIVTDCPAGGFTESEDVAKLLAESIKAIPSLDRSKLLIFGGWESASRCSGSTLQILGELLDITEQFQGVDSLTTTEDGRFDILERIEGGLHQSSTLDELPAVFGWATGELPVPPNNPKIGMLNMRGIMASMQKSKPSKLTREDLEFINAEVPKATRETRVVKDMSTDDIAKEIVAWLKEE